MRIGKEKIRLGSVVIADIDFNVLSCFSMQERGWRTGLGATNSYVVKGKMRFPIQMAERAWWMTSNLQTARDTDPSTLLCWPLTCLCCVFVYSVQTARDGTPAPEETQTQLQPF